MDRRKFIGSAAAVGAAASITGRALAKKRKPNIIIIMADDLGYGDLSCYGSEAIKTPAIDKMAGEGVKLTQFFSSGPVCSPSRAGLLTGRYPLRAGVPQVYFPSQSPLTSIPIHMVQRMGPGMDTKEITLAQAIKPAGYATCCIGKWHLGDMKQYRPHHRGFDHYFGVLYSNDMDPFKLYRNDEVVEKHPADQRFLTQKYTEEAIWWIEKHKDDPFLLYLPHTFPHIPLYRSPGFEGVSEGGVYGDAVEELDWSTAQILATLDRLGISEDTFVFFTSDNGPWYQGSAGMNRGRKGETFDGGMQVPGIARWPGVIPEGEVRGQMSMNFDLFTTALAIAGVAPPADRPIDGKNILPLLKDNKATPHEALYFYDGRSLEAMRTQRWKYRKRHTGWGAGLYAVVPKGPMLFDMENDPNESYDVSELYPEVAEEMKAMIKQWDKNFVKGVPRNWSGK